MKPCPFKSKSDIMIGTHKRAIHLERDMFSKMLKEEEPKEDSRKSKRVESKITKFTESKTHDEIRVNLTPIR